MLLPRATLSARCHALIAAASFGVAALLPLSSAAAATESVLYSFGGGADGGVPEAGPVRDSSGALYGTTLQGGAYNHGAVFKLTPRAGGVGWTETVLHSFTGGQDGASPQAGLIRDSTGALYGTTAFGGTDNSAYFCEGCGTVFKLTPPAPAGTGWILTVLHNFPGGSATAENCENDGGNPSAGLMMDKSGALYGTTEFGGSNTNAGTVFKLTPPPAGKKIWSETVLHCFTLAEPGVYPVAGLVMDAKGALYGTTSGTVFKLTPPASGQTRWTETLLYTFTGGADGHYAVSTLIMGSNGALYGTKAGGGTFGRGMVFELTPPVAGKTNWTETVLHAFEGGLDSAFPIGGLTMGSDGTLYGTTQGGVGDSFGTAFSLTPPAIGQANWHYEILHHFVGVDGSLTLSGLIQAPSGALFGTTSQGGSLTNAGAVFELSTGR